jgi:hypothetical protein
MLQFRRPNPRWLSGFYNRIRDRAIIGTKIGERTMNLNVSHLGYGKRPQHPSMSQSERPETFSAISRALVRSSHATVMAIA